MRRGLMAWDPQELPKDALDDRLVRLRAMMRREKLDAFLLYTNLVRPSAVCWLTGFTPYWSEGALLVLSDGAPVFATALSKRVANWMRTVNPVSEIVNSPRPGKLLGERLVADGRVHRLGVLELDALPSGLYDDLVAAAPIVEPIDASAVFAGLRRSIDDAERRLLAHTDAIAVAALERIDAASAEDAGTDAGTRRDAQLLEKCVKFRKLAESLAEREERLQLYAHTKTLFTFWNTIHIASTWFLFAMATVHVATTWYYGLRWIP